MGFAGIISTLVGILISSAAIMQNDYLWLIGSIPLTIIGIILLFVK